MNLITFFHPGRLDCLNGTDLVLLEFLVLRYLLYHEVQYTQNHTKAQYAQYYMKA